MPVFRAALVQAEQRPALPLTPPRDKHSFHPNPRLPHKAPGTKPQTPARTLWGSRKAGKISRRGPLSSSVRHQEGLLHSSFALSAPGDPGHFASVSPLCKRGSEGAPCLRAGGYAGGRCSLLSSPARWVRTQGGCGRRSGVRAPVPPLHEATERWDFSPTSGFGQETPAAEGRPAGASPLPGTHAVCTSPALAPAISNGAFVPGQAAGARPSAAAGGE